MHFFAIFIFYSSNNCYVEMFQYIQCGRTGKPYWKTFILNELLMEFKQLMRITELASVSASCRRRSRRISLSVILPPSFACAGKKRTAFPGKLESGTSTSNSQPELMRLISERLLRSTMWTVSFQAECQRKHLQLIDNWLIRSDDMKEPNSL